MKSDRLKKLEAELADLEQWMKLGLVPKKDLPKHKEEIKVLATKIQEEKDRLQFLKESGEVEEYVAPKRTPARQAYSEQPTMSDISGNSESYTEAGVESESETTTAEETQTGTETETGEEETMTGVDEEDPFSDRNRWRRGIMNDPDMDSW